MRTTLQQAHPSASLRSMCARSSLQPLSLLIRNDTRRVWKAAQAVTTVLGMEDTGRGTFPCPGQSPAPQVPATLLASSGSPQLWVSRGTRRNTETPFHPKRSQPIRLPFVHRARLLSPPTSCVFYPRTSAKASPHFKAVQTGLLSSPTFPDIKSFTYLCFAQHQEAIGIW